jgi:hypothetical protein
MVSEKGPGFDLLRDTLNFSMIIYQPTHSINTAFIIKDRVYVYKVFIYTYIHQFMQLKSGFHTISFPEPAILGKERDALG